MAFQRVPNTVEIDVVYTQNLEIVQNTFYAQFGGAYSLANLVSLAAAMDIHIAATWLFFQTLDCTYTRVDVRGLNAENDFFATANANTGPGLDIVEALPNNVTLSLKKVSGFTGRSARGRTYWIGMPSNKLQTNENLVDEPYTIAIEGAIDSLRAAISAVFNWSPVLVSRFSGGVERAEGVTFGWIGTTCVNLVVDTQRGRLPT